jgi:hypothetical protein
MDVDPVGARAEQLQGYGDGQIPDVSGLSLEEYGKVRGQLIRRSSGDGVGIFGPIQG